MSTHQFGSMTPQQARGFMPDAVRQPVRTRLAQLVDGRPVLDIGCGRAEEVGDLFTPEQYLGVDVSPELIALCRERWPGYRFWDCAAQDLPKRGRRWPVAIMKAVLEHVPTEEAVAMYDAVRSCVDTLYLAWHWEPGHAPKKTWYDGELGRMQQNRHDMFLFRGVMAREVVERHVIWTVEGGQIRK